MGCEDNHMYCPEWANAGYCRGEYENYMMQNCKYSCNYCRMTTTTTTTMATPPIANCEDESQYCSYWASMGECSRNPSYMMAYCKRSCNACDRMTTTPSCTDANDNCPYWTAYCAQDVYRDYLRTNCERSCGYCQASDVAVPTTTQSTALVDPSCMDRRSADYCTSKKDECTKNSVVRRRCEKSCGFC
jgi:hypothetical protein